jgi:acyl carrier protein
MYVGGEGVARGYLNRESLTATRFLENLFPGQQSGAIYRSGDLARRLANGDLEYLGRADQQVKIRGFRIELGEIQSALTRLPSVREAFVTALESCDGEKDLVAYVVPKEGEILASDRLRMELQSALPVYMVPSRFVLLSKLPLTSNGKIDRAALPSARTQRPHMETPFRAPQSEMERNLQKVFQDVLNIDSVGVDDDFFALGGNSLRVAEAHARLEDLLDRRFSAAELFVHTTVRNLAMWFSGNETQNTAGSRILDRARRQREALSAGRSRR